MECFGIGTLSSLQDSSQQSIGSSAIYNENHRFRYDDVKVALRYWTD
jgi:hypothetical protein